jgi:hypothetical protein
MTTQDTEPKLQHTPGPYSYGWDRDGCNDYWYIFPASDESNTLASILFWDSKPGEMAQTGANARLFAAAPELLEMLKRMLSAVEALPTTILNVDIYEVERDAKILVAKTEGRV